MAKRTADGQEVGTADVNMHEDLLERIVELAATKAAEKAAELAAEKVMEKYEARIMGKVEKIVGD